MLEAYAAVEQILGMLREGLTSGLGSLSFGFGTQ